MDKIPSIKVFACDHRSIPTWTYPFIRVGTGFNNNSAIKDITEESICDEINDTVYSEGTAIWWIWKHLSDFGNPDYVGFCHYRRFFTDLQPNMGMFPIVLIKANNTINAIEEHIISPEQQLAIMQQNNVEGILPMKFIDYSYAIGCKDVKQIMKAESDWHDIQLNMPKDLCDAAFDILLESAPDTMKDYMHASFFDLQTYHFNVFTLRRDLFETYCNIMFSACEKLKQYAFDKGYTGLHNRWIAYVMERYSSCIFKMLIAAGHRLAEMPMLTFDGKAQYK